MQNMYLNDTGEALQNPNAQQSSLVPWWTALSSVSSYEKSLNQLKSSSLDHLNRQNHMFTPDQQMHYLVDQVTSPNDSSSNKDYKKRQKDSQCSTIISLHLSSPDNRASSEFDLGHPTPYLHESRHLHAMRRARGQGGRFLNTKTNDNKRNKDCYDPPSQTSRSPSSEILQIDSRNINYVKEDWNGLSLARSHGSGILQTDNSNFNSVKEDWNGLSLSSSEVTSIYSRENLGLFHINNLNSS